jgi:cellulose biosynthesis protein BcsQ
MTHRAATANNKGGTGKTNDTVNELAGLARAGHYVLGVDMDPQGNLSRRLAARTTPDTPTISEAIKAADKSPGCAADCIVPCGWDVAYAERIHVITAGPDLLNRAAEPGTGAARRLKKAMEGVDGDYAFTAFDCPSDLGLLTQMAFCASNSVRIVTEPEYDSIESALRMVEYIGQSGEDLYNPALKPLGVIINKMDSRLNVHKRQLSALPDSLAAQLAESFRGRDMSDVTVWNPVLPDRSGFKTAIESAVPVEWVEKVGGEFMGLYDQLTEVLVAKIGLVTA